VLVKQQNSNKEKRNNFKKRPENDEQMSFSPIKSVFDDIFRPLTL